MLRQAVLTLAAAAAGLAAWAAPAGAGMEPPCRGHDVAATFTVARGSAAAGSISYVLRLRNRATAPCFVSGLAQLRLLDRKGRPLPTRVHAEQPGQLTAVRVVLAPGGYAAATARFSPDVPGVGEPRAGRLCEPTAFRVRVTPPPGGGLTVARVTPPTPVCEHGSIALSALVAGRKGPHTP